MNNEIREKDHEWVKMFHSNIDRLLVSSEKLFPIYLSHSFLLSTALLHCNTRYIGTAMRLELQLKIATKELIK